MCRSGAGTCKKLPSLHASFLTKCIFLPDSIGECKSKQIIARRNCEILLAVYSVGHRRGMCTLPHVEMPERFPCMTIYRLKGGRVISEQDESGRCRHNSRERMRIPNLRNTPDKFILLRIISNQHFFRIIVRAVLYTGRVVGLSFLELFYASGIHAALFQRHEIKVVRRFAIRRRKPVCGASKAGTETGAVSIWHEVRPYRPAILVNSLCPILLQRKLRCS